MEIKYLVVWFDLNFKLDDEEAVRGYFETYEEAEKYIEMNIQECKYLMRIMKLYVKSDEQKKEWVYDDE